MARPYLKGGSFKAWRGAALACEPSPMKRLCPGRLRAAHLRQERSGLSVPRIERDQGRGKP
jgi:hypothetical protein